MTPYMYPIGTCQFAAYMSLLSRPLPGVAGGGSREGKGNPLLLPVQGAEERGGCH